MEFGIEFDQQGTERAGPLGACLSFTVKHLRHSLCCTSRHAAPTVGPLTQGNQHLARILEIAAPQQGHALAGQAVGCIGAHAIVGQLHLLGRRCATFGLPPCAAINAVFNPADLWQVTQNDSSRRR
jgi:hypothetical protein